MQTKTAHELLIESRAAAKRRRDLLKRLIGKEVFWRKNNDIYLAVTLKGRSTQYSQSVAVWSSRFKPDLLHHACVSRIVEKLPEGFVEFTIGPFNGAFVRVVKPVQVQEKKKMASVLQEWVQELPLMQQSVLLSAIRGPDGQPKYNPTKMLIRWYRRCVLISAFDGRVLETPYDPNGGGFTGPCFDYAACAHAIATNSVQRWYENMSGVTGQFLRHLDALPSHYIKHFREAIQILGYKHPDTHIRHYWHDVYIRMANDLHLLIEPEEMMDKRLSDNRSNWLATTDTLTEE
jgi:hypothetical protein